MDYVSSYFTDYRQECKSVKPPLKIGYHTFGNQYKRFKYNGKDLIWGLHVWAWQVLSATYTICRPLTDEDGLFAWQEKMDGYGGRENTPKAGGAR